MQTSIAVITSADTVAQRVVATLKPTEQETGWLDCLTVVHDRLVGQEALVVPANGSLADALVIPFPVPAAVIGTVSGATQVTIDGGASIAVSRSTHPLEDLLGRDVILVPTPTGFVVTGVLV